MTRWDCVRGQGGGRSATAAGGGGGSPREHARVLDIFGPPGLLPMLWAQLRGCASVAALQKWPFRVTELAGREDQSTAWSAHVRAGARACVCVCVCVCV